MMQGSNNNNQESAGSLASASRTPAEGELPVPAGEPAPASPVSADLSNEQANTAAEARGKGLFRQLLGWCGWLLLLPLLGLSGIWLAAWLGYLFGLWNQLMEALLLPVLVLPVMYWLAPALRPLAVLVVAVVGAALACSVWWPSYYPEWHSRAYQTTFVPLWLFAASETLLLLLLCRRELSKYLGRQER